jgi:hypothetical protein
VYLSRSLKKEGKEENTTKYNTFKTLKSARKAKKDG